MIHSNTINEPYTFEQELTHLLILVCWFLFIAFSCHLLEATPQQGGPSREATLCRLPLPPALTLPDTFASLAFQGGAVSFALEPMRPFSSSRQRKRADILRTASKWQEAACVRIDLSVQMCMFVQMRVNKWLKVMFSKINSWELDFVYITARVLTRDGSVFLI